MRVLNQDHLFFPASFAGILIKSIQTYAGSFLNYFILACITYLPFLILIEVSRLDLMDFIEFFHGNFLDIIIFLTLPTLFINKRVFPLATISLFMQRFFASAVVISLVQLGTLLFFITFFAQISLGAILVGVIPYLFLLFAGFFLIMENAQKLISIRMNLLNSVKLVRGQFFSIFWNFISITFMIFLPLFFFTLWYLGTHPDMIEVRNSMAGSTTADTMAIQRALQLLQEIIQEGGFKWSRIAIHVLFRPLKSLFLAFLFLGIIQRISPSTIVNFLGRETDSDNDVTPESDPSLDDETNHPEEQP